MKILLTTLNAKYVHSSLALRNLAAYCAARGVETEIKEYTINQAIGQILSDIYRQQPQVIGIACYIWNIRQVAELCKLIKKVMPEIKLVLGGPEVAYDAAGALLSLPVDFVIQGEGEQALANLLLQLLTDNYQPVAGVACRKADEIITGDCQTVNQLDDLPFAYKPEDLRELSERIIYYESSRGCPFSCQYCLSSATRGVRFYSLQRVLSDLQKFIEADVKQIKFVDRTFNTKKEHYLPILRFLAKQNCRTNFHFEIAADILDEEAISILNSAPSGRFQLEIGVQSVHEPTLEAIQRYNDWPKIADNVAKLLKHDSIHLHLDLIVGLPHETIEIFSKSFNSVYLLQPHMLQIGFLKLLKGSGIRRMAAEHQYIFTDEAPYEVLANRYISYGDIRLLHVIEDVFNHTYNCGRFLSALRYLVDRVFKREAFSFYLSLAQFWEEQAMDMASHSPKALYEFIYLFCRKKHPDYVDTILQFLKFDALNSDSGNIKPDFLLWTDIVTKGDNSQFWRNELLVKRYLPDFRFTSWREVNRYYQIELFKIDIPHYLATGEVLRQDALLLFDYRSVQPVWQRISLVGGDKDAL